MKQKKQRASLLIGAMNMIAIGDPLLINNAAQASNLDHKIELINSASLKLIESSWLRVPNICKARGFNASPVALENKMATSMAMDVYSSYEA